eukprot:jgi/Mesvir1/1738/Mv21190-RA.1
MGAQNSTVRKLLEDEFNRVKDKDKDFLVLDQLIQLHLPVDKKVDLSHLAVIYMLDANHDGRILLAELYAFADMVAEQSKRWGPHEFESQMQGFCTLQLWRMVAWEEKKDAFLQWMMRLLCANCRDQLEVPGYPGTIFLSRKSVQTLHGVLQVHDMNGMDFQSFFDLLQRMAEEQGMMLLEDAELDDVVPLPVVHFFMASFIDGFRKFMPELELDEVSRGPGQVQS